MKIKNIAFLSAVAALFISCGSTPATPVQQAPVEPVAPKITPKPDWVDEATRDKVFDPGKYIARVGRGYTKAEAAQDAEKELASYFGEKIKSETVAKENFNSSNDTTTHNQSLDKVFTVTIDKELFAANKTKPWFDPDFEEYYVCAYLDRFDTFEIQYKPILMDAKTEFYKYFNDAVAEEDIFRKMSFLRDAKRVGDNLQTIINEANALVPSMTNTHAQAIKDIASVEYLIKETQSKAKVNIVVKNDYGPNLYNYLSEVFTKNGFIVSNSDYHYEVVATVDKNRVVDTEWSGIITDTPSLRISLEKKDSGDTPFTYEITTETRSNYHDYVLDKNCYADIKTKLDSNFESELQSFLRK